MNETLEQFMQKETTNRQRMSNQTTKERYSCKGTALAAANFLRVFGFDAEPKFLKGIWRVVIHETEGDYWHREVKSANTES